MDLLEQYSQLTETEIDAEDQMEEDCSLDRIVNELFSSNSHLYSEFVEVEHDISPYFPDDPALVASDLNQELDDNGNGRANGG